MVPGICPSAASRQAVRSAHSPMSMIASVSSASGMNSAGRNHAAFRMLPAHQGFGAADPAVAERGLQLIMQMQLVAFGGVLQVARQGAAGARLVVHRLVILRDRAALRALAAMHRELGVAQHLVALGRVGREDRVADRGGEADRLVADLERLGETPRECARRRPVRPRDGCLTSCRPRNSSPLWRARNSPGRGSRASGRRPRSAADRRRRGRTRSLTSLKPSRSIEKAASLCAFSWASAASKARRSLKAMRFGRPVMASLNES